MDAMGDADELEYDDLPSREPFLTAETRAVAGAGLVLMSVMSTTVFQYAAFLLFENSGGTTGRTNQYLLLAGPCAVLALAGASLGWSTRTRKLSPVLRGVAGAAVLVGAGIALLIAATAIGGYVWGDAQPQDF